MALGAGIGIIAAAGIGGMFHLAFPWLINLALAKLTLVGSAGVMAAGAVVHRLAVRREIAAKVSAGDGERSAVTSGDDNER